MNTAAFIVIAFLLFLLGITSTTAAFCLRERNTANDRYDKLYDSWRHQIKEICELTADHAAECEMSHHWREMYDSLQPKSQTVAEAPVPEV